MPLSNPEREDLRHVVLDILVARHPVALPPQAIARHARREVSFAFTVDELDGALEFWRNDGKDAKLTFDFDEAGATKWWRATAAGLLKVERSH